MEGEEGIPPLQATETTKTMRLVLVVSVSKFNTFLRGAYPHTPKGGPNVKTGLDSRTDGLWLRPRVIRLRMLV